MMRTGFKIQNDVQRLSQSIIDGFRGIPTPNIADVMGRFRAMDASIKPVNHAGRYLVGSAFTVRTHPSDNLMVHKAMDLAQPGDVIVVDACGDMGNAILGEIMCHYAKTRGIAGYIVDGPVRDLKAIADMDYPVLAKGGTPRGPYKEGPGEINTPVSCGNVPVHPGDLIVGDDDGSVVIPKDEASTILEKARKLAETEEQIIQAIYNGKWDREWVDETLHKKGCKIVE